MNYIINALVDKVNRTLPYVDKTEQILYNFLQHFLLTFSCFCFLYQKVIVSKLSNTLKVSTCAHIVITVRKAKQSTDSLVKTQMDQILFTE